MQNILGTVNVSVPQTSADVTSEKPVDETLLPFLVRSRVVPHQELHAIAFFAFVALLAGVVLVYETNGEPVSHE